MSYSSPKFFRHAIGVIATSLVLLTAACGTQQTVFIIKTPSATVSTTTTPSATASPVAPTVTPNSTITCDQALPGAAAATGGSKFTDIPFPNNSTSQPLTKIKGGGTGQFTIWLASYCTPGTSADNIRSFYATQFITSGWLKSNTFPFDDAFQDACGDPYCWARDTRYVGLEKVSALGNGVVTYNLRFATPPLAPICTNYLPGYYYKLPINETITTVFNNIALPPLTQIQNNDAAGGQRGFDLCSASPTDTLTLFISDHLIASGWHQTSNNGTQMIFQNGMYTLNILYGSSPVTVFYRSPSFNAGG